MTIKIAQEPDIVLTTEEYEKYAEEYRIAFMNYAGTPPSFETWVRSKKTMNEGRQLLTETEWFL